MDRTDKPDAQLECTSAEQLLRRENRLVGATAFEPATGCKVLALIRELPNMSENWRIPLCLQGTGRFTASNCTPLIWVS
jgi:hypothetical protein